MAFLLLSGSLGGALVVAGELLEQLDQVAGRVLDQRVPHGGNERLGGEVLGDGDAAAARQEIAVDLRQRDGVDHDEGLAAARFLARVHTPSSLGGAGFRTSGVVADEDVASRPTGERPGAVGRVLPEGSGSSRRGGDATIWTTTAPRAVQRGV